jgi:hypothetical protein
MGGCPRTRCNVKLIHQRYCALSANKQTYIQPRLFKRSLKRIIIANWGYSKLCIFFFPIMSTAINLSPSSYSLTGSHCGKWFVILRIAPFPPSLSLAGGLTRDHQANYLHPTSNSPLSEVLSSYNGEEMTGGKQTDLRHRHFPNRLGPQENAKFPSFDLVP